MTKLQTLNVLFFVTPIPGNPHSHSEAKYKGEGSLWKSTQKLDYSGGQLKQQEKALLVTWYLVVV